jgi:hypothetical protein
MWESLIVVVVIALTTATTTTTIITAATSNRSYINGFKPVLGHFHSCSLSSSMSASFLIILNYDLSCSLSNFQLHLLI